MMYITDVEPRKESLLYDSRINKNTPKQKKTQVKEFMVEKKRWYMLLIYGLLIISTGIIWISLSPVMTIVRKLYKTNDYSVVLVSVLHFALFTPGTVCAIIYYNHYNLRYGLVIGSIIQAIGAGIK